MDRDRASAWSSRFGVAVTMMRYPNRSWDLGQNFLLTIGTRGNSCRARPRRPFHLHKCRRRTRATNELVDLIKDQPGELVPCTKMSSLTFSDGDPRLVQAASTRVRRRTIRRDLSGALPKQCARHLVAERALPVVWCAERRSPPL